MPYPIIAKFFIALFWLLFLASMFGVVFLFKKYGWEFAAGFALAAAIFQIGHWAKTGEPFT